MRNCIWSTVNQQAAKQANRFFREILFLNCQCTQPKNVRVNFWLIYSCLADNIYVCFQFGRFVCFHLSSIRSAHVCWTIHLWLTLSNTQPIPIWITLFQARAKLTAKLFLLSLTAKPDLLSRRSRRLRARMVSSNRRCTAKILRRSVVVTKSQFTVDSLIKIN